MMRRSSWLACIAATMLPGAALAGPCADAPIDVTASDAGLETAICDVAETHLDRLETCGLALSDRVALSVVDRIEGQPLHCVGLYECALRRITVLSPEALRTSGVLSDVYEAFPPDAAFASLIRHEVTHAAVAESASAPALTVATQEFLAYAFEVEGMRPDLRQAFLDRHAGNPPMSDDIFNVFIVRLLPGRFAALAWTHFARPENGCALVADLISGRRSYGDAVELLNSPQP